jgi:predicted TPR repeat methyltransferase
LHDNAKEKLTMPDGTPQIRPSAVNPDIVASRISALLAEHRPGAVKPLLAALAKLAPEHKKLPLLRADYWCEMRDIPEALAVLHQAILQAPSDAALWLRQAEIFFGQGRSADAVQSAAQTVLLAPDSNAARSRLALALMQLEQFDKALPCLAESFSVDPTNVEIALALAALSPATAIDILEQAIACNRFSAVLPNALTRRYLNAGNWQQAMRAALQAIGDGIADAQSHCLLAFAQIQESRWDEAAGSARRAQSMAPGNLWAARLLAALASRETGRLMPLPNDALTADAGTIAGGTIIPGAFRALLAEQASTGPVLDVFCGAGLNAIAAQGLNAGPWSGIDPDAALIERCAELGIYATLEPANPFETPVAAAQFSIILLNEALAYLASPQSFLAATCANLQGGGVALAAIPTGQPGLNGHGLFTHSETAIAQYAAAAGLAVEISRAGVLRYLEGIPIHGVIAVFRRL